MHIFQAPKKAFTLIELIVVMAIVITLSIVGFISYNSYVRDGRNTTRTSHLEDATIVIDRFIFNEAKAPRCRGTTGFAVCYFTRDSGSGVADAAKAKAVNVAPLVYVPGTVGIESVDWDKLNLKTNPVDPRDKLYYLYASNGGSKYMLFAVKEENSSAGFSTMVRGYLDVPASNPVTDVIQTALGMSGANTVHGWKVTSGVINTGSTAGTDTTPMLSNGSIVAVPYRW